MNIGTGVTSPLGENPLVTVVMPVFNVAPYFERCIGSVVGQTYSNLQIVLVDDGSDDGSSDLCDEWASRDSRIEVTHLPQNMGQAHARNVALRAARGELYAFVDSDDYVVPHFIATLLQVLRNTDADIAECAWKETQASQFTPPTPAQAGRPPRVTVFSGDEAIIDSFYQRTLTCSLCRRLYRAHVLTGYKFHEGKIFEDLAAEYPTLSACRRVAYVDGTLYYYLHHTTSTMGAFTSKRTVVIDVLEQLEHDVASQHPSHLGAVRSRLLSAYFNILMLCPGSGEYRTIVERCWQGICRLRWGCLCDSNVRLKNKGAILASVFGCRIFRIISTGKRV